MFRPHNRNATATAIIEGLAVSKYNKNESRWEVTFLRNCGHYPKLRIREVNKQSGKVSPPRVEYEIRQGDSISITVSNPRGDTKWKYETGGEFDRNDSSHDAQDLRWMLNIDKLHHTEVKRRSDGIETNFLYISNSCFYTSVMAKGIYRKRWVDRQHIPSEIEPIGLTGRTFGADFEGNEVTVEVKGSTGFRESLPHKDDVRYEIIFDNTCVDERQPSDGETDFHFYYRLFDESEGKVEIFPPDEIEADTLDSDPSSNPSPDDPDPDPQPEPKTPACYAIMEDGGSS